MRGAAFAAAAVLLVVAPQARAQTQTGIPNSPWTVTAVSGSSPACTLSGIAGQGRLSLTVLGSSPGVVRLQLDKPAWSIPPGDQVRAIFHFAGLPDVSLSGMAGGSLTFNLAAPEFPAWMHGFSAAQSATIEFPGTREPPWTFDLRGTTSAVDAVQRCITAQNIAGAPAPFVSASLSPAARSRGKCLQYDPAVATVAGTVGMATGYGPPGYGEDPRHDPKFQYARLTLDQPVCVTGGNPQYFEAVDGIREMQLFPSDHGKVFDAQPWLGRRVVVTGAIEQKMVASEAATQLYVNVRSIQAAP
jgi:hypothetical protein